MGLGLILSALSGAGQGINQVGVQEAKNIDEINKAKMIEKNKYELLEENRRKDAAAVDEHYSKLRDDHINSKLPALGDDATPDAVSTYEKNKLDALAKFDANQMNRVQAAINAGQFEHAAALAKIATEGNSVVGYGGVKVDSQGNIIYDNSLDKKANEGKKADAIDFKAHKPGGTGGGSSDKNEITFGNSLIKTAKDDQIAYKDAQKTLTDLPRNSPQYQEQQGVVAALKKRADTSAERRDEHLNSHKKSGLVGTDKPSDKTSAKTGDQQDFSNLWK